MQISRSADADWPTSRPTWLLRCFGCSPDATRIQLLWALADRELSVNDLAGRVGKPSPSVSQHLAKLRMARLVRTRREGTQVFYRLETTTSASSSPTRCTTPSMPPAACPPTTSTTASCGCCTKRGQA